MQQLLQKHYLKHKNMDRSLRSVSFVCMCDVKRMESSIKSDLILSFIFSPLTFICTDMRQAESNYKHQQPIKEKWMGLGQMGPYHPYSIWYVITTQKTSAGNWPLNEKGTFVQWYIWQTGYFKFDSIHMCWMIHLLSWTKHEMGSNRVK